MKKRTEKMLFLEIWEEQEHVSEVSGKPLLPIGSFKWHWQFAHILNKGRFPSSRLDKNNIMLMLPEEHERQETFEIFRDKKIKLMREYYEAKNG
jgi:hypothetical protein